MYTSPIKMKKCDEMGKNCIFLLYICCGLKSLLEPKTVKMYMKRLYFFLLVCCIAAAVSAQNEPVFLFKQMVRAKIHFKNRSITVVPMNYDAVNDKMYFKRDGQLMELMQTSAIDSVVWAKQFCFVCQEGKFLEKCTLKNGTAFIHWQVRSVNIGAIGALGQVTQAKVDRVYSAESRRDYSADIYKLKNRNDYYLPWDGGLKKVTTLKQILKLFPEHQADIERYAEERRTDMQVPQSVLDLLDYCLNLAKTKP